MNLLLEIFSVGLSLIFLILLIKENINCWFFGILGSLVSIFLFYRIGLYAESILYLYYVLIGLYGYQLWATRKKTIELPVIDVPKKKSPHLSFDRNYLCSLFRTLFKYLHGCQ